MSWPTSSMRTNLHPGIASATLLPSSGSTIMSLEPCTIRVGTRTIGATSVVSEPLIARSWPIRPPGPSSFSRMGMSRERPHAVRMLGTNDLPEMRTH